MLSNILSPKLKALVEQGLLFRPSTDGVQKPPLPVGTIMNFYTEVRRLTPEEKRDLKIAIQVGLLQFNAAATVANAKASHLTDEDARQTIIEAEYPEEVAEHMAAIMLILSIAEAKQMTFESLREVADQLLPTVMKGEPCGH